MIIDAFTFFNELDLLEARLEILDKDVDAFVIVESNKTQSLKDKPYYFAENEPRFKRFRNKIVYIKHQGITGTYQERNESWRQEQDQRSAIETGLNWLNLPDSAIVMVSDLDEIPRISKTILEDIRVFEKGVYTIPNKFFAYYMNLQGFDAATGLPKYSDGTVVASSERFKKLGVSNIWAGKSNWPKLHAMSGWHFSWLGGPQKVREKSLACIEPFDKSCVPSEEQMEDIFRKRVIEEGYFNINHPNDNSVRMERVDSHIPIVLAGPTFEKFFYCKK